MEASVSFDHVADSYDETRALPEPVARKLTDALLLELRAVGAGRLLEIGAGTGRISRPLMERGVRVAGLDIAPRMLGRLRAQLGPQHTPPDLALADATRLPLRDASFRAVLMVHVLHLVSDWKRALDEMRRVLAPGGVFLHDRTRYDENNPWSRLFERRAELFGALGFVPRSRPSPNEIASQLEALGASLRTAIYAEDDEREVARDLLSRARNRVDSWTWEIPDDIFPTFFSRLEAVVRDEMGGVDVEHTTHVQYELEVWSFP